MNPQVISRHTTSARILFTGAAAVLALGTALASGAGAAAAPRGARAAPESVSGLADGCAPVPAG